MGVGQGNCGLFMVLGYNCGIIGGKLTIGNGDAWRRGFGVVVQRGPPNSQTRAITRGSSWVGVLCKIPDQYGRLEF